MRSAAIVACVGLGLACEPASGQGASAATASASGVTARGDAAGRAKAGPTSGDAATASPAGGVTASAGISSPVAPDGTRALPCTTPPEGLACVPGGPFVRGSDDGPDNTRPRGTVWLQTFYIDTHEVTYAQYKACEAAGRCARAGPRYDDYDRPRQPIVGVSWHDAVAYCAAHGKHLPSEAQWEKAARGPDGARYSWGDEPATCERAVIKEKRRRSCGVAKLGERPDKGRTFEVGSKPPGAYGLYDMAGNAWEWVADWASPSWAACGAACAGVDPRGPCDGATPCKRHHERIVRGGSWYWEASHATAYYRRPHVPSNRPYHHYGFRCAASVDEAAALLRGPA